MDLRIPLEKLKNKYEKIEPIMSNEKDRAGTPKTQSKSMNNRGASQEQNLKTSTDELNIVEDNQCDDEIKQSDVDKDNLPTKDESVALPSDK